MAIDDNTVYGLTGAQVKELPGKIEAVRGAVRELTMDDYNYPADNPDGVALWLLNEGVYIVPNYSVKVWRERYVGMTGASVMGVYIIGKSVSASTVTTPNITSILWMRGLENTPGGSIVEAWMLDSGGTVRSNVQGTLITTKQVINNLTSAAPTSPLSANQGKVLNDKIGGDLSNLTTIDKTSLINAINEVAAQGGAVSLTNAEFNEIFGTFLEEES